MLNYNKLSQVHPSLSRGQVWCTKCGASQSVKAAGALQHGWPKCCGYTMTIDSPAFRLRPLSQRYRRGVDE